MAWNPGKRPNRMWSFRHGDLDGVRLFDAELLLNDYVAGDLFEPRSRQLWQEAAINRHSWGPTHGIREAPDLRQG
jgi:hypothetical protein